MTQNIQQKVEITTEVQIPDSESQKTKTEISDAESVCSELEVPRKGKDHRQRKQWYSFLDINKATVLSCQPRVTVMSCFVYIVIRDLQSTDHLCINPIRK